jgi:hypothetical protein
LRVRSSSHAQTIAAASLVALISLSCDSPTEAPTDVQDAIQFGRGNGAPTGSHYNLNIIGVPKDKDADMTGNSGHRIFVDLAGKTRIDLKKGETFQVLDANGTDGRAEFQLPNPDPDGDGETLYSVYVRALGKPGGNSTTTTCANDPVTGELVCSTENLILIRDKGKSTFTKADKYLLFIFADLDGDGTAEKYPLFDEALEGYYWDYDNRGLKLVQMRFYYN